MRIIRKMLGLFPMEKNTDTTNIFYSLERLSKRAQIPTPKLYLLGDCAANAFSFQGRGGEKWIVFTEGLLQILNKEELEAVLALCIAQLKLKHFRTSSLAVALSLPWVFAAKYLPVSISIFFQAIAALLVRIWVKPDRIYYADAYAAQLIQNPSMIATAVRKISNISRKIPLEKPNIAVDHLFLVTSIREEENILVSSYDTHPRPEERIQKLLDVSL